MMLSQRIGFLGAGKMAAALAGGFIRAGLTSTEAVTFHDPVAAAGEAFKTSAGGKPAATNRDVAAAANILFLAVKPQQIAAVVGELKGHVAGKLVVSVAAGVTLQALQHGLGEGARVVRVMPNTPCLIGKGASAFALGHHATADDAAVVQQLLESVGSCYKLDEKLLDAVTGLSGSGPAFVYVMIEALADGGVRMGLPRDVALGLAASTVCGAAAMVLETNEHPGRLKDQVASPGGTTIAGLHALEVGAVRGDLISAVEAATRRSIELGKGA